MFLYRFLKKLVIRRTNVFKNVTVYRFFHRNRCTLSPFLRFLYSHNFYATFFPLTPPKSINEKSRTKRRTRAKLARSEVIEDKKSINNQRTEAERATRRYKQSTD